MYNNNQHRMYRFVYQLITEHQYDLLFIDEKNEEVWLEKYIDKTSYLVRILSQDFNWKNHLKKDIASVFQRVQGMKRLVRGKRMEIYNIYFASYSPVDEWEMLKRPMKLKDKTSIMMHVFYFDDQNLHEEQARLQQLMPDISLLQGSGLTEGNLSDSVQDYKQYIVNAFKNKVKEEKQVFSYAKPFLTYILLALNIAMFFLLEWKGGSQSIDTLISLGAKYNPAILDGEWWRIVSSMFLHIGFLHLVLNMIAIYYLGTVVEKIYGKWRFFVIYMLAGIGGGIASFTFSPSVAAGASGALFGLFGALMFFGLQYKKLFFQTMGTNVLMLVVINIVFGFIVPQVDNSAHLGGLVSGFIAAGMVHLPQKRHQLRTQLVSILAYCLLIGALLFYGIPNNLQSPEYQLTVVNELQQKGDYREVVQRASKALDNPKDFEAPLLFQRSYAYIQLGEYKQAIDDLEKCIHINSNMHEAYFNLAILYNEQNDKEKAIKYAEKANALQPDNEQYKKLMERINKESES
ncbi:MULTISPECIES: rhomboid family intramembrane serine protease [unclassified Virgibacillus]|uniref:rhomboid family intramembrane serine protease n=1 Tax=unclassified Virgibacillus TaxID=2620237 RepID=UPI0024DEE460|nr:rhomboid family intramembrane serine protease [Virgibacillus sp. LDC-1]